MPSSTPRAIEQVLQLIIQENPTSVLDLGIGYGKYGHLCREYLEMIYHQAYRAEDWKIKLDGVEAFAPYIQTHQQAIYNRIFIRDLDTPESILWLSQTNYDLYLALDIFEHLTHWKEVFRSIPQDSAIIALSPLGVSPQGAVFGNEYERHVNTFQEADWQSCFSTVEIVAGKLLGHRPKS
jgi:hypothetical protein